MKKIIFKPQNSRSNVTIDDVVEWIQDFLQTYAKSKHIRNYVSAKDDESINLDFHCDNNDYTKAIGLLLIILSCAKHGYGYVSFKRMDGIQIDSIDPDKMLDHLKRHGDVRVINE